MKLNTSQIKLFIGKVLTSKLFYNVFIKQATKNSFVKTSKGLISIENQNNFIKSLLFWGLYENSERKTIERYIKRNLPVIELGASIGMTTLTICKVINEDVSVIAVEANPLLIPNLKKTKEKNQLTRLELIHSAIDYSNQKEIPFIIDDRNLGSRKGSNGNIINVPTSKLNELIKTFDIRDYVLVSDIEGAEAEILESENEPYLFENCKQIIIELHDTHTKEKRYTKQDLADLIIDKFSMKILYKIGQTWVFEKLESNTK